MGSLVTVETGTGVLPAYVETLPRGPDSVRAARRLVGLALTVWGMDPGLRDSAQLVTSELVTNAVRHTRRAVRVTVTRLDGDRVKVAVVDLALTHPAPRSAGADQESGRGLQIVAALAKRQWGVDTLAFGKRVWAVVSGPGVEPGE
ncbi:ATP-binding protein [Streptomyces sp. SID4920]|nr:ATP-binding protein [Streptomyces sp. SID4920]MYX64201.1 ATP-binding protein [Streptomyces sp. SID8373]